MSEICWYQVDADKKHNDKSITYQKKSYWINELGVTVKKFYTGTGMILKFEDFKGFVNNNFRILWQRSKATNLMYMMKCYEPSCKCCSDPDVK
jgi:hypothetical protein